MKSLYLIRHAKSSWKEPLLIDYQRPLNNRGKHDAPLMADKIAAIYSSPERIISSGAKRASATAKHFLKKWDLSKDQYETNKSLYLCSFKELEHIVLNAFEEHNSIAIVAHNPTIENFLSIYCNFNRDKFPTCGVAHVQYSDNNWILNSFHYPKQYY